jgi:hypothetical protein
MSRDALVVGINTYDRISTKSSYFAVFFASMGKTKRFICQSEQGSKIASLAMSFYN